ncbi:hypothetical protein [Pseudoxanthomonas sacheonensis]|uniref:hypothetical protein n=1 Tax=Pseudoxanthomonas sacheonensis TaxID=443615 RepID=UPI0013D30624|nr:hypothetical protein [Pseudoxanthomonas sacheonensis]
MKTFQFILQCIFCGPRPEGMRYGFFATFNVQAGSLKAASGRLPGALMNRINAHELDYDKTGFFKLRCRIVEMWELTEDDQEKSKDNDMGFSFFRIGRMSAPFFFARFLFEERRRSHLIVHLNDPAIL